VFIFAPRNNEALHWAKGLLKVSHAWANGTLLPTNQIEEGLLP